MWAGVTARFRTFHQNLCLTDDQIAEGTTHHQGVLRSLNSQYYNSSSDSANSFLIGSWGRHTNTRPPRDIDFYFVLPDSVRQRIESVQGNKQSYLLQEIRHVLQRTYPNTSLRGDGQVVVVGFTRMSVEIVPAFRLWCGQYSICDTHEGGRYKTADPQAELAHIATTNIIFKRNLLPLVMMMKAWQTYCNVPLKSFCIELVAADFLWQCSWGKNCYFWYDWIMRDFFSYLCTKVNQDVVVPGTNERISLGNEWVSRARTAYDRAVKACDYEYNDWISLAGEEWQKIFGTQIPQTV